MENWTKYDMYFDQERSRANASAALVSLTFGKGKRQKRPPAQFKELGPFVGPNEPKSSNEKPQTKAKESGPKTRNRSAKRRLAFPVGPVSKKGKIPEQEATASPSTQVPVPDLGPSGTAGPSTQVPVPTDLVQIKKAHKMASKDIQKITWAQSKLLNKADWLQAVHTKPTKITSLMFDVLPKKDVVAMALQLCKHCATDCLEEVLEKYCQPTLQILNRRLHENFDKITKLNAALAQAGKDSKDDDGPTTDVDATKGEDGSKDEDGPKQDGPKHTPNIQVFEAPSHWIRSDKCGSGYKGVNKCKDRGSWRAKCGGVTIGRFETKGQACQAYYDYCKAHGKLPSAKKPKVRDVLQMWE